MQMRSWFKIHVKNHRHWLRQEVYLKFFYSYCCIDAEKRQERHQYFYFLTAQNIKRRNYRQEERKHSFKKNHIFFPKSFDLYCCLRIIKKTQTKQPLTLKSLCFSQTAMIGLLTSAISSYLSDFQR